MKHLKITFILYLGFHFSITLVTSCDKNPAGLDLNEETDSIPWDLISGKIAYRYTSLDSDNVVRTSELIIIDGDEGTVTSIAKGNSLTYHELAWSDDGAKIVYSDLNLDKGRWELIELNLTSREQKHIYSSEYHCNYPSWSKDGRLAYTGGWYGIWIDGEIFYRGDVNATPPTWSPDSNYLVASVTDSTSQGALYKINLADTSKVLLIQGKGEFNNEIFYNPKISPDGNLIAYVKTSTDENINGEIWLMNTDGTNHIQLTDGHVDWHPEWSTDGQWILFERNSQLFIISIDGSKLTRVTKSGSPFHSRYAEWIQ